LQPVKENTNFIICFSKSGTSLGHLQNKANSIRKPYGKNVQAKPSLNLENHL